MKKSQQLEALLAIITGLMLIYWFTDYRPLLGGAVLVGLAGLFSNWLTRWIAIGWFGLAEWLGKINGTILLGLIFMIFLTPLAFLSRLFKKNSLQLRPNKEEEGSYYIERDHQFEAKDLEQPW
ncbi:MAG: hypothetical protein AAFP19_04925 [Bacteroidota bacterium]